jgi:hypothetical protein
VLDSAGGRRLNRGTIAGGRQLNAGPLGGMSTQEPDSVGANPWAWAGAVVVLAANGSVYYFAEPLVDAIATSPNAPTIEAVNRNVQRMFLLLAGLLFLQAALSAYLGGRQIFIARSASGSGRFPPLGVRLLLPMRVQRDQLTVRRLVLYYRFSGVCNLLIAFAALWAGLRAAF